MSTIPPEPAPSTPTETFRRATQPTQRREKLAADIKHLVKAKLARRRQGEVLQWPAGIFVDSYGDVTVDWGVDRLHETVQLLALAEATESLRWGQQELAQFVGTVRKEEGCKPSKTVERIVGNLASLRGSTIRLSHFEIAERLRDQATRINRKPAK